jgi:hypothetical protein
VLRLRAQWWRRWRGWGTITPMAEQAPRRGEVVDAIAEVITALGWRIRTGDRWQVVLLPPLAEPRPERDRWPDQPHEGFEPMLRDRQGGFTADRDWGS